VTAELFVVPTPAIGGADDGGDGPDYPDLDELMLMAQRIIESAIAKIDWNEIALPLASHLVTDPEDAKVIAKLAESAVIEVSFYDPTASE
jgi:hypothetical protein